MFIQFVLAAPSCSLDQLIAIIAQQEESLGPLYSVGNNGVKTKLGFDIDQSEPSVKAVLNKGTAPAGGVVVCQGVIFGSGTLIQVYATR